MGWFKLFGLEKALMGGDLVTAVIGTEMNRRNCGILWYRRQGESPELAEVKGSPCSHGVTGNCGANWHRML